MRLPAGVPRLCGLWLGKGRGRDSGLLDGGVNLGAVSWGAMVNLKQSVIVHYNKSRNGKPALIVKYEFMFTDVYHKLSVHKHSLGLT